MKAKIRKVLKWTAAVLGVLVLGVVGFAIFFFYIQRPRFRPAPNLTAPKTPEAIERGKYLANNVTLCVACHSTPGKLGAGRADFPVPGFPGEPHVPNITSDKETGIGAWTDGEIFRAMREGMSRDDHPLFPMMPYQYFWQSLDDDDALAIIAYVRTFPPIENRPGRLTVKFPLSMIARAFPSPNHKPPPRPPASDKKAYGEWMLKAALCSMCHDTFDEHRSEIPGMRLAGGLEVPVDLPDAKGTIRVPNITSDKATGIGSYSDEDIRRVLDEGVGKAGPLASRGLGMPYEMPWYAYKGMTNEDKEALIAALRAVPPVTHAVAPSSVKR